MIVLKYFLLIGKTENSNQFYVIVGMISSTSLMPLKSLNDMFTNFETWRFRMRMIAINRKRLLHKQRE